LYRAAWSTTLGDDQSNYLLLDPFGEATPNRRGVTIGWQHAGVGVDGAAPAHFAKAPRFLGIDMRDQRIAVPAMFGQDRGGLLPILGARHIEQSARLLRGLVRIAQECARKHRATRIQIHISSVSVTHCRGLAVIN
jgi:hypothetical protein